MIVGNPAVQARQLDHPMRQQASLVLTEHRGVKDRLVQRQIEEPAEQQVGLQVRAQLAVGPPGFERLQHLRLQQRLGRNRPRTFCGTNFFEVLAHLP